MNLKAFLKTVFFACLLPAPLPWVSDRRLCKSLVYHEQLGDCDNQARGGHHLHRIHAFTQSEPRTYGGISSDKPSVAGAGASLPSSAIPTEYRNHQRREGSQFQQ